MAVTKTTLQCEPVDGSRGKVCLFHFSIWLPQKRSIFSIARAGDVHEMCQGFVAAVTGDPQYFTQ